MNSKTIEVIVYEKKKLVLSCFQKFKLSWGYQEQFQYLVQDTALLIEAITLMSEEKNGDSVCN